MQAPSPLSGRSRLALLPTPLLVNTPRAGALLSRPLHLLKLPILGLQPDLQPQLQQTRVKMREGAIPPNDGIIDWNWEDEGVEPVDPLNNYDFNNNGPVSQPPEPASPPEPPPWLPDYATTKSGRLSGPGPKAPAESREQCAAGIVTWKMSVDDCTSGMVTWQTSVDVELLDESCETLSMDTYLIEKQMQDPIAFAAIEPDTLYYSQVMRAPDQKEFRIAMEQEVKDHKDRKHWIPFPKSCIIPMGTRVLQGVWAFKRKFSRPVLITTTVKLFINYMGRRGNCTFPRSWPRPRSVAI
jgi:hypothetical protein